MSEERVTLHGVAVSSVLLIAFGCLLALYCLFFSLALLSDSGRAGKDLGFSRIAMLVVGFGASAYLSFKAGLALRRFTKWAAYVASGVGIFLLLFGIKVVRDAFNPYAQPSIEGGDMVYGTMIAIPCIAVGLWWCVYLNLPHVRRHLATPQLPGSPTQPKVNL